MLLFQKRFHEGLVGGQITLTFRRWPVCRVRAGSRYRCHPIGVLEVDDVIRVPVQEILEADALRCGFGSRAELIEYMASASEEPLDEAALVWRIGLRHAGDGDRVALALEDQLTAEDVRAIAQTLERFDARGAWTAATLAIVAQMPQVAASKLAATLGRETQPFKADVVKLKKLGLTQSFEVGYELAPRGRAYLAAVELAAGPRDSSKKKPAGAATPRGAAVSSARRGKKVL